MKKDSEGKMLNDQQVQAGVNANFKTNGTNYFHRGIEILTSKVHGDYIGKEKRRSFHFRPETIVTNKKNEPS